MTTPRGGLRVALLLLLTSLLASGCALPQQRLSADAIRAAEQAIERPRTIALLGGTGLAGSYLLREALARGYPLRVLSRSPQKLAYLGDRVTVIEGDARDPAVLDTLLQGADAVISAIGPVRADGAAAKGISSTVTGNLIATMQRHGLTRYLVVSGAGVAAPGDDRNATGWWMRQLVKIRYPAILRDKQAEYQLLADSDLQWTVVRCPLIESGPYVQPAMVSLATPATFRLRAAELAEFVLEQLETADYHRRAPFVYSR